MKRFSTRKSLSKIGGLALGLIAVVGFFLAFVKADIEQVWVTLTALIVFLAFVAREISKALYAITEQKYPDGYQVLAYFVRYTNPDEKILHHQTIKIIQAKYPLFLSRITHKIKWTGNKTRPLKIDVQNHQLVGVTPGDKEYDFDIVEIKLQDILLYDQVDVIPITITANDSDKTSVPQDVIKIEFPTHLISWRIELDDNPSRLSNPARVERRRIAGTPVEWELLETVDYHPVHKCYEKTIFYPEEGYFYQIRWDRMQ